MCIRNLGRPWLGNPSLIHIAVTTRRGGWVWRTLPQSCVWRPGTLCGFTPLLCPCPPVLSMVIPSRATPRGLYFPQHGGPRVVHLLTGQLASKTLRQKLPVIVRSRLGTGRHNLYQNLLLRAVTGPAQIPEQEK